MEEVDADGRVVEGAGGLQEGEDWVDVILLVDACEDAELVAGHGVLQSAALVGHVVILRPVQVLDQRGGAAAEDENGDDEYGVKIGIHNLRCRAIMVMAIIMERIVMRSERNARTSVSLHPTAVPNS